MSAAIGLAFVLAFVPLAASALGPAGTAGAARPGSSRGATQEPEPTAPEPWKQAGQEPLDYRGPGRDLPEPDVEEVVLGWFGPGNPDHPKGGDFWRGASVALDEVNRSGGYAGKPFRLVCGWSDSPWAAGIVEVTRIVYERGAWALLGAIDGASAHLAEQVALKSRVSLVSSGSTDPTANMGNVPWFFSCLPSDARQAPILVDALEAAAAGGVFVVAAAAEHDAHAALVELRRELSARHLTPEALIEFDPAVPDPGPLAERLLQTTPRAVLVAAPPASAGALVAELRRQGFHGTVIGGAPLALRAFRRAAGEAAEGVVAPRLWEPSEEWDTFARMYENRWGEPPDYAAAQSYDAVRLVAQAVRRAGLNRARIRDALRDLAPWRGAAGEVQWDTLGRNERPVGLATWRRARLVPLSPAGDAP